MWLLFTLLALSTWSVSNVIDSIILRHYESRSIVQTWWRCALRLPLVIIFPLFVSVQTDWLWWFAIIGICYFLVIATYMLAMKHVDASVAQSSWAIQGVITCIIGFTWFGERWSSAQTVGAVLVMLAVLLLCYWHQHVSIRRTLWLLLVPALLSVPPSVISKAIADAGVPALVIGYWAFTTTALATVICPLFVPSMRREILGRRHFPPAFYRFNLLLSACSLIGFSAVSRAYAIGTLSLVSIVSNTQPFFVIFYSWLLSQTKTSLVPKEVLTRQSLQTKFLCFGLMFVGLGLLLV